MVSLARIKRISHTGWMRYVKKRLSDIPKVKDADAKWVRLRERGLRIINVNEK